jgi:hypothetical protein
MSTKMPENAEEWKLWQAKKQKRQNRNITYKAAVLRGETEV